MSDYHDIDGNPVTLPKLCKTEPEWAANQITDLKERNALLEEMLGRWSQYDKLSEDYAARLRRDSKALGQVS
jgi:hypothetical protein